MTTEAALTKLSYLLALPELSTEDVIRQMSVSIRGELSEQSEILFRHPDGLLSPNNASASALSRAIECGDVDAVRDLLQGASDMLLNQIDQSGNTPLVSPVLFLSTSTPLQRMAVQAPSGTQVETRLGVLVIAKRQLTRDYQQHHAAIERNLEVLRELLSHGASVHLRNRSGRTPLFLAASTGLKDNVMLLRQSGAHLHASELGRAWMHWSSNPDIWEAAGVARNGHGRKS